ncbi:hypothetical protein HDU86_000790 [Geranomyces michiganensis]|nr:hypothetical protein HDU86_000790 [Geranomyces michiganensis]
MFPSYAAFPNSRGRTSPDATSSGSPELSEEALLPDRGMKIIFTPQKGSPSSSRPLIIDARGTHERDQRCLVEGVPLRLGRAVKARDLPSSSSHPLRAGNNGFGDFFQHPGGGMDGNTSSPASSRPAPPTKPTLTAAGVVLPNTSGGTTKSQQLMFFNSKVVSRRHAEIWTRDGQVYLRDMASSSGTFLNRMRLSPSGKESRPYPLKSGDVVQLGLDYVGDKKRDDACPETVIKDSYRAPVLTLTITYPTHSAELKKRRSLVRTFRQLLGSLLTLTNPYAESSPSSALLTNLNSASDAASDCVICLSGIGPYQALFLSPCSHMYHYKCVKGLVNQGHMFSCPLCRQIANLDASVSMDSLCDLAGGREEDQEDDEELQSAFSDQAPHPPDVAAAHDDIPPYAAGGTERVRMEEPTSSGDDESGNNNRAYPTLLHLSPRMMCLSQIAATMKGDLQQQGGEWPHVRSHSVG